MTTDTTPDVPQLEVPTDQLVAAVRQARDRLAARVDFLEAALEVAGREITRLTRERDDARHAVTDLQAERDRLLCDDAREDGSDHEDDT